VGVTLADDWSAGQALRSSWQPVPLAPVLDPTWEPPQPTVGRRTDGVGLFYPGKVHTIASESEAGKSWLALAVAADVLAGGDGVLYIDFEDDEGSIVRRLLTLQVAPAVVEHRFRYLRPAEPLGSGLHFDALHAALDNHPGIVVLDGITEAMTLHGLDPLRNSDAAVFGRLLPRRIAALGPAVVCLDHVTKDRDGRGRYALGAAHKLNGLDGAAYLLDNRTPFGIGLTGRSTIRIAKDRPGQLRRHALPSTGGLHWYGDLVLTSHADGFAEVEVTAPVEHAPEFRPTGLMERVAKVLEQHGPLSQRKVEALVTGKTASIREALTLLQVDGYVSDDTPHRLLRPYSSEDGTP